MADRIEIYLPVARFVSGSLTQKRTQNARGLPIAEDKQTFDYGLALRKDSPDAQAFWGQLIGAFKQAFAHNPNVHPVIDQWLQNGFQGFSGKVSDGDRPNTQGNLNTNTAGCWVIWCSSRYPTTCSDETNAQIDPAMIERGYYCDATLDIAPNNNQIGDGIGCFVTAKMLRLRAIGEVIRGGVDTQQLGASMPMGSLPQGASPVAQGAVGGAPLPGMGQPAPQQPMAPAVQQQPMGAPVQQPITAPQQVAPPAPAVPMAPAVPAPTAQMPGAPAIPVGQPVGTPPPAGTQPVMPTGSPVNPGYPPHPGVLPQ